MRRKGKPRAVDLWNLLSLICLWFVVVFIKMLMWVICGDLKHNDATEGEATFPYSASPQQDIREGVRKQQHSVARLRLGDPIAIKVKIKSFSSIKKFTYLSWREF